MAQYGLPYKGSKSKIAKWVIGILPSAQVLYDIFAGGCAITHCALLSGKYDKVFANDISFSTDCFADAIAGKYKGYYPWVSHQEFDNYKRVDPAIALCYSFGNDGWTYAYGKDIEPYKRAMHQVICGESIQQRRLAMKRFVRLLIALREGAVEHLERLQSLEHLERLQFGAINCAFEHSRGDYRDVEFVGDDIVVYCDPPYKCTRKDYKFGDDNFNREEFYDWCCEQTAPLYISEYAMPEDRFVCIAQREVACSMSVIKRSKAIEKIFRPKHQVNGNR